MITLIACTEINNGIGDEKGNLLFNLPKDMQHFKATTSGKIVVMGRKTWDSLPKKPLEKRKNYVLTYDESFSHNGVKVIHSIEEILKLGKTHDVFVIGGGEVYQQLMPFADRLMMTHVHVIDMNARVFFPEIDIKEYKIVKVQKHEADEQHNHSFTFATYERIASREELEQSSEQSQSQSEQS